jgi:periplasmic copper chaperone A
MTLLVAATMISCVSDEGSWRSGNGELAVNRVVAPAPANVGSQDSATMAIYATIANVSAAADTLIGIESVDAGGALIHTTMDHGAMKMMVPATFFIVPADSVVRLAPGGTHIMLERLTRALSPGDTLPLTLVFRRAGRLTVNASVFAYDQLDKALEP